MPVWPKRAVAQRNARRVVRPVRWAVAGPMWLPTSSGREQQSRPALDVLAVDGVVGVRGPDAVGAFDDAQVDAGASGGAGLDLHTGVEAADVVDQCVQDTGLTVHSCRAVVDGFDEGPVVVPLQVGDGVFGQQRVDPLQQVGVYRRVGEIEDVLVALRGG